MLVCWSAVECWVVVVCWGTVECWVVLMCWGAVECWVEVVCWGAVECLVCSVFCESEQRCYCENGRKQEGQNKITGQTE